MEQKQCDKRSELRALQMDLMNKLDVYARSAPDDSRAEALRETLRSLCNAASARRVILFERLSEVMQSQIDCFDAAAGFVSGEKPLLLARSDFETWAEKLKQGMAVLDDQPQIYGSVSGREMQLCLLIPIRYGGRYFGTLLLENPDREIAERLLISAPLLGSYLGAIRNDHQQQAKLDDLQKPLTIDEHIDPEEALRVLSKDYTSVYYVDLVRDVLMPIRVESGANATRIPEFRTGQTLSREKMIQQYCESYVMEADREAFLNFFDRESLEQKMSQSERVTFRYRSKPNLSGRQFFEALVIRVSEDPAENKKLLVAFRHMDDLYLAEQRHQQELEQALQKERLSNEILSAISKIYYAIFRIDLEQDLYEEVSSDNKIHHLTGKTGKASTEMVELCNTFVVPEYRQRILRFYDLSTLADRLQNEETIANDYLATDGNWHTARFIVKRRNAAGRVTHVLYVTRLISDTKRREQNWILIAEEANKANAAKTEFISQIAHDIRTPLNAILGFLTVSRANLDDPEKVRYGLDRIQIAGDFLHELVEDVLDISRIENGQMKLQPEQISLKRFFEEFPAVIDQNRMGKELQFHYDIHDIFQDWVLADPLRLKQVYTNILSNAVKYTPSGGSVSMEVFQQPEKDAGVVRLVVYIRDTGIGMSKEYMEKMYAKFSRETDTRINKVSGYGLGLSIVKQLMDLMGGTIQVESTPGKGTSFRLDVVLQKCRQEAAQAQEDTVRDYGKMCSGMHILVAEDNELNFEVVRDILAMYNVICQRAIDGAVCVEEFRNAKPHAFDAILMDMQMPNMNGLEATAAIRNMPIDGAKTIPIIAMTANAFREDVQNCLNAGMTEYLSKPIDVQKLLRVLASVRGRAEAGV